MASVEYGAHGAGVSKEETGGITERSEEEIKQIAQERGASWSFPPSGLYVFEIYEISEKVEAVSAGGKKYTYRQVLGFMHGRSGNLEYSGEVLLKVLGTQGEILRKIAESPSKKCLIDIRKWNGNLRISGIYGIDYILGILDGNSDVNEVKEIRRRVNGK